LALVLAVYAVTIGSAPAHARNFRERAWPSFTIPSTVPFRMAMVDLKSRKRFRLGTTQKTNGSGEFDFGAVPLGPRGGGG